jgi:hypothetical protein
MDLGEIEWVGVHWIGLTQDRDKWRALLNTVMNLSVPMNAEEYLSGCTTGSFSSGAQLHIVIRVGRYLHHEVNICTITQAIYSYMIPPRVNYIRSVTCRPTWLLILITPGSSQPVCQKQNKLRGLSKEANYTDRATAACLLS